MAKRLRRALRRVGKRALGRTVCAALRMAQFRRCARETALRKRVAELERVTSRITCQVLALDLALTVRGVKAARADREDSDAGGPAGNPSFH